MFVAHLFIMSREVTIDWRLFLDFASFPWLGWFRRVLIRNLAKYPSFVIFFHSHIVIKFGWRKTTYMDSMLLSTQPTQKSILLPDTLASLIWIGLLFVCSFFCCCCFFFFHDLGLNIGPYALWSGALLLSHSPKVTWLTVRINFDTLVESLSPFRLLSQHTPKWIAFI